MAVVTSVRFEHEHGALYQTLRSLRQVDVRVLRDAGTDPESDTHVFMFAGTDQSRIEDQLSEDVSVATAKRLPDYQGTHVFAIKFSDSTELLAPVVTAERGFSLEARRTAPETGLFGWSERWLLPHRDGLTAVWEQARDRGFSFEILAISEFNPNGSAQTGTLTAEQRTTLQFAYERGYFEEPRETSLEDLAAELDLSSTAVGGRIRRGINALVEATVVDEPTRTSFQE